MKTVNLKVYDMNWIKRLFSKKETTKQCDIHVVGKREFYRIITPQFFSDLDAKDLDEAKKKLKDFGSTPENKEHYEYWQEKMKQCKMVKVTEIVEDIFNDTF